MRKIFIRAIIGIIFLAIVNPIFAAETSSPPTVKFDKAIHFFATDGSDVVVVPGTYQVEAAEEWLRLIPGERRDALLLDAQSTQHEETIEESIALSFSGDEDTHHLVLLLPGGKSLQSIGSVSGVRSRRALSPRTRASQAQIRQRYRARQQQLALRR